MGREGAGEFLFIFFLFSFKRVRGGCRSSVCKQLIKETFSKIRASDVRPPILPFADFLPDFHRLLSPI